MSDAKQNEPLKQSPSHEEIVNFFQVKQQMVAQFQQNYQAFIKSLAPFPIMQRYMGIAMDSFEIGFTMFQKGMDLVPFQSVTLPAVTPSQPETPKVPDENSNEANESPSDSCETDSTEAA